MKHLSAILYCAAQNRDNRNCCKSLGLDHPELQVGRHYSAEHDGRLKDAPKPADSRL
jgi:hypothetical protein